LSVREFESEAVLKPLVKAILVKSLLLKISPILLVYLSLIMS